MSTESTQGDSQQATDGSKLETTSGCQLAGNPANGFWSQTDQAAAMLALILFIAFFSSWRMRSAETP